MYYRVNGAGYWVKCYRYGASSVYAEIGNERIGTIYATGQGWFIGPKYIDPYIDPALVSNGPGYATIEDVIAALVSA